MNSFWKLPILYSFRRCPYAIRARLALQYANVNVEHREVDLKNKHPLFLETSQKATVPVLITTDKIVIEESLDIMYWALNNNDPKQLLAVDSKQVTELLTINDGKFKKALNGFKYSKEQNIIQANKHIGEEFLVILEEKLTANLFLLGSKISIADIAILPFVRQFAKVDWNNFKQSPYPKLIKWLDNFLASEEFAKVMTKYNIWGL